MSSNSFDVKDPVTMCTEEWQKTITATTKSEAHLGN